MERIDILTPDLIAGGCPEFTVNTGLPKVSWDSEGTGLLYNGSGKNTFHKGESIVVLSAGIILPLGFQLFCEAGNRTCIVMDLDIKGATGEHYTFQEMGGKILMPMDSYELYINTFCDVNNVLPGIINLKNQASYTLYMKISNWANMKISMNGVPLTLNGTVQRITPFIKILHTFWLT